MNQLKFTIKKVYPEYDEDFVCDVVNMELRDEKGACILSGDWYHDKIDAKITGFFDCLRFLCIDYTYEVTKVNCEEF